LAISGGEDYELLLTTPRKKGEKLLTLFRKSGLKITPIGEIVDPRYGMRLFQDDGREYRPREKGYDHFKTPRWMIINFNWSQAEKQWDSRFWTLTFDILTFSLYNLFSLSDCSTEYLLTPGNHGKIRLKDYPRWILHFTSRLHAETTESPWKKSGNSRIFWPWQTLSVWLICIWVVDKAWRYFLPCFGE